MRYSLIALVLVLFAASCNSPGPVFVEDEASNPAQVALDLTQAEAAAMDIRPGSCPNRFNPKSNGVVWVALLGSSDLDVAEVIPTSLVLNNPEFSGPGAAAVQTKFKDGGGPTPSAEPCACPSGDSDGYTDLHIKFRSADIAAAIGTPTSETVELALAGTTSRGTSFVATDCVTLVGVKIDDPPMPEPELNTEIVQVVNTYWNNGQEFSEIIDFEDEEPDTVPMRSWLTVFYDATPGPPSGIGCVDVVNQCIRYQKQYTRVRAGVPGSTATTTWLPSEPEDNNPFGTADSTSLNMGSVEYTIRFRAVDETNMPEQTPAEIEIVGNHDPTLDAYSITNYDGTVAANGNTFVWDWWHPANFPDTLDLSDPIGPIVREFYFTIKASGHDHPKETTVGGVKSWLYLFSDANDPLQRFRFANAGLWTDTPEVNSLCDTFKVTIRYGFDDLGGIEAREALDDIIDRLYDFEILGRDIGLTEEFRQFMFLNGVKTTINAYNTSSLGRWTAVGELQFRLEASFEQSVAQRRSAAKHGSR